MYHCIKKHDTDIAVASVIRIKASGKFRRYSNYTEEIFYTGFNNLAKTLKIPSHWQVWGILYKKKKFWTDFVLKRMFIMKTLNF